MVLITQALAGNGRNARGKPGPSHKQSITDLPASRLRKISQLLAGIVLAVCCVAASAQETENEATQEEPARIYQAACPALLKGFVKGANLPPIAEDECGEKSPLEITALMMGDVQIEVGAELIVNCRMAEAFHTWTQEVDAYAEALLGSRLARVDTGTSYQCRRRNNAPTGKISEHGFANAIDISGFRLADGRRITLVKDWGPTDRELEAAAESDEAASSEQSEPREQSIEAQFLRYVRDRACTQFSTVLSPESNALHADHFHLDLGCHGKKCTYRLCE